MVISHLESFPKRPVSFCHDFTRLPFLAVVVLSLVSFTNQGVPHTYSAHATFISRTKTTAKPNKQPGNFTSAQASSYVPASKGVPKFISFEGKNLTSVPTSLLVGTFNVTSLSLGQNQLTSLTGLVKFPEELKSLVSLSFSHNFISDIKPEFFAPVSYLENLNLSYNALSPTLPKNSFKMLKKLKVLDLSFNNLSSLDRSDFTEMLTLMYLNLSCNSLSKLPSSIFSRNAQLVSINLSKNRFKEVDSYFLKPVRFLREISFENNQVSSIARKAFGTNTRLRRINLSHNSLKEVSKDMFSNFALLEQLDLSHNNISKLESGSFQKLFQIDINLSYNFIEYIPRFCFVEVSNIRRLDLSYNKLNAIHTEAFDYSDVTQLILNHNMFTNSSLIPLNNLTSISLLNVSYNSLTTIDRRSFTKVKLYEMAIVDLSHNQLKEMSGSVFEKFWALRSLNISNNNLTKLGYGAFGNLPTLLDLNLNDNSLKEVSTGALVGLISVKDITIQRNRLRRVPTIPVAVNHMDLSNNSITSVTCSSFPMINSLLTINLSENNITSLETDSFCNLLTLREVKLRSNRISNVNDQVTPSLLKLSSLQSLDLSENQVTTLNNSNLFGILPSLFHLNLSHNQIQDIAPYSFNGLLQLLSLDLSSNRLESISMDSMKGLVSLQTLNLSDNSISRLGNRSHSFLEDLLSLEYLSLKNNRISYITKKSLPSSPWVPYKLKSLDLSNNLIESLTVSDGFTTIEQLDLAHNHIRKLTPGVFGNFSSLKHLDLSDNRLTALTKGSFSQILPPGKSISESFLEYLILKNNKISNVDPQELLSLRKLKLLDLSSNPLNELPCPSQVIARMAYKGVKIEFHLLPEHQEKSNDHSFCNEWLSINFRIKSSSYSSLHRNPSKSSTLRSIEPSFPVVIASALLSLTTSCFFQVHLLLKLQLV